MSKLLNIKRALHKLFDNSSASPLRRRLIKGLGANAFAQAVNVLIQLASVPIFIHFWGANLYGKWLILSAIPGYLTMSDIGFGSIAGNEMTMLTGRQEYQQASRVFQSAWVFVTSVSSVIGLLAIALAYLLPFDSWLNLESLSKSQVSLIISLLAAYTLVSQQGGLIDAAFRSDGRYAQGMVLANVVRLMETVLVFICVFLGGQLIAAALTLLISRILGLGWMWLMFRRVSQWLNYGWSKARLETILRLFKPAVAFMAFPISQAIIFQGMTLVVGGVLGSVAVVVFTTSRTVTRIVSQLLNLVNFAVWPELSNAFGSGNLVLARKIHQKASLTTLWLSIATSTVLVFIGPWLLSIWTNRQVEIDILMFYLMLLLVISSSFWQTSSVVLMATNTHNSFAKISLIGSLGAIIIAYILLKFIGISAAPLALIITDILTGFYAIQKALKVLKETFSKFLRALFDLRLALS